MNHGSKLATPTFLRKLTTKAKAKLAKNTTDILETDRLKKPKCSSEVRITRNLRLRQEDGIKASDTGVEKPLTGHGVFGLSAQEAASFAGVLVTLAEVCRCRGGITQVYVLNITSGMTPFFHPNWLLTAQRRGDQWTYEGIKCQTKLDLYVQDIERRCSSV